MVFYILYIIWAVGLVSDTLARPNEKEQNPPVLTHKTFAKEVTSACPISVDEVCYSDLATAIRESYSSNKPVIKVWSDVNVPTEIQFNHSLTIIGHGVNRPQLTTTINSHAAIGTMLRAMSTNQSVVFQSISFANKGLGYTSALRTLEIGNGAIALTPTQVITVSIADCTFRNFRTQSRGGSAVFIGKTSSLLINHSVFIDNTVEAADTPFNYGGGALWVAELSGSMTIAGTRFKGNLHKGIKGVGGAFTINHVYGKLSIENGIFVDNQAAGGAAIYMGDIHKHGQVTFANTLFRFNHAIDYGMGSQGGVVYVPVVSGSIVLKSSVQFVNNSCKDGRGGVFANDKMLPFSNVTLNGYYKNNICASGATIWDTAMRYGPTFFHMAEVSLESGAIIEGGLEGDEEVIIMVNRTINGKCWFFTRDKYDGNTLTIIETQ